MTLRGPRGTPWDSWVERQIRAALGRGDFESLPGAGKPIPYIDEPYDAGWWIRKKLRQEKLSALPPALALRREIEKTLSRIPAMSSEEHVRRSVEALNEKIRKLNAYATSGPPSNLAPFGVDDVVERWRRERVPPNLST